MSFREGSHRFTVYLVDVDTNIGNVLRPQLESVRILFEAFEDPADFFALCDTSVVQGCLLLSVRLPGMSGFEAYRVLKEQRSVELPTIFLGYGGDVPSAVRAMKLGAVDYFEHPPPYEQLVERIQSILRQERTRLRRRREVDHLRERMSDLTKRETQVLKHVVNGKLNKQIARMLRISPKTVEMHRARVMTKLDVRTVADLVRKWCASRCDDVLEREFLEESSFEPPAGESRRSPGRLA